MPGIARKVVGVKAIQGRREEKEKEKAEKETKAKEGKSSK
jgi:hypothetical protein